VPIFVCPAALDAALFLVLFAVSYGAGERGMGMAQCAWLGGSFQLAYMVASPISGLLLTRRNARWVLILSTVIGTLLAVACVLLESFAPLIVALSALAVAVAFFFNSFQTFMRGEAPPGGLIRATALYTLSWSTGCAAGFILSGTLYRLGPWVLAGLVVGIGLLILTVLSRRRTRSYDLRSADEHVDEAHHGRSVDHASYVWVAWIMVFSSMFVQRPILTFYPALAAQNGLAPALAGLPLFLHMAVQGCAGYYMTRLRRLLYRRSVIVGFNVAAAGVLVLVAVLPSYPLSTLAIAVLGLWSGFSFFCSVYYAGNSGNRSRNIGINECLVGLGSFAGLFVCEWAMKYVDAPAAMYGACAAVLLVSAGLQWVVAGKEV